MSRLGGESRRAKDGPMARRTRRGEATVTLRVEGSEAVDSRAMLDPAAKSLADALKITYHLLLGAMFLLIVLFLVSGFQSVGTSQSAIRVTLGDVAAKNLAAGFQPSWPAPIGELVRIEMGEVREELNKEFFPHLSDQELQSVANSGPQALANSLGSDSLDPASDGQLLTADGNIAHARCLFTYNRSGPEQFAHNIDDKQFEKSIVRAAVKRGVIQAAASVTLDEFIKDQPDDEARAARFPVSDRAREAAQRALDALNSGIQIQQLSITPRMPPRRVMGEFNRVQSAQSEAAKAREEAMSARNTTLLQTAGMAAGLILERIDQYERDLALGDAAAAEATLNDIDRLLLGQSIEIHGKTVVPETSGRVTALLDDARQYATSVVGRAKSDAGFFAAKREAFVKNPLVMLNADWSAAYTTFLSKPTVQTLLLPPGVGKVVITINRDPQIAKEQEEAANAAQVQKSMEDINRKRMRALFEERLDPTVKMREQ